MGCTCTGVPVARMSLACTSLHLYSDHNCTALYHQLPLYASGGIACCVLCRLCASVDVVAACVGLCRLYQAVGCTSRQVSSVFVNGMLCDQVPLVVYLCFRHLHDFTSFQLSTCSRHPAAGS